MAYEDGKTRCRGKVWRGWHDSPCSRRATTPEGYCGVHDPDKEKARRAARDEKWRAEYAAREAARTAREAAEALPNCWRCVGEAAALAERDAARALVREARYLCGLVLAGLSSAQRDTIAKALADRIDAQPWAREEA
jgi:hypothetical protein